MAKAYWLVKSEPYKYSFDNLVRDGRTIWDGVRNFEARNHLRSMTKGDLVLFYHSNEGKEVVGIAEVLREAYPDPTTQEDWSVVELGPKAALAMPIGLAAIRLHPVFSEMQIVKRSRLSVTPVTASEFREVVKVGKAKL
jgi:predicted RNA-binding protein with PUA-like domain